MADVVVSTVVERLTIIIEKQISDEINLVRGVKKELHFLSSELTTIREVLDDAETKGYKNKSIQHWLKKLEDLSYDMDDVLDEWNFAILKCKIEGSEDLDVPQLKTCSFLPCSSLSFKKYGGRRDIAVKIRGLKERLDVIVKEKDRYAFIIRQKVGPQGSERVRSTSSLDVSEIHGREIEKDALLRKLTRDGQEGGPTVISIVGTGGIGKTTLAQLAYNDPQVKSSFELKIWICVSDVFDEIRIAKGIVEAVTESSPNLNELEKIFKCLEGSISGKRFLLVLDDVWTEDYTKWEPFKNSLKYGGPGSKILVTTRSDRVARTMGTADIHHLGLLSDMDCWLLMSQLALFGRREEDCEELQDIGKNIAKKCNGLPLAAKVLGSLLAFKDTAEEWEDVFRSEIWRLEKVEVDLFPHLFLSYKELSPAMKRCFSYCAIFPKDFEIDVEKLIGMWMALGYLNSNSGTGDLELRGKEYFDNLRMRSFFQDYDDTRSRVVCKMHDIVHDFAQFLRETTNHIQGDTNQSLISQVKVYRSLFYHMELPHSLDSVTCIRILTSELIKSFPELQPKELPQFIEKSIHLRYLSLSYYTFHQIPQTICKLYYLQRLCINFCELKVIPKEIGNLIHLRHLDLSGNPELQELPETIYNLQELRTLNLEECGALSKLPEGIDKLINLRQLCNKYTDNLYQIPQGLEQLTRLQTLSLFKAGRGGSKLGYLNKLDQLSGSLELNIHLDDAEDVVEATKAELRNKKHIKSLDIKFSDRTNRNNDFDLIRHEFLESLWPPPYLSRLTIYKYYGTRFPGWITSSLNHLKVFVLVGCYYFSTLPPLGKLPCLEQLSILYIMGLEFLDREFLGIPGGEIDVVIGGFPKLKKVTFSNCLSWKEWKDITEEEAANDNLKIMPCLTELEINSCGSLSALPHRLLRKASALEHLTVKYSRHLWECYQDKDGSDRKSLSQIPRFEFYGFPPLPLCDGISEEPVLMKQKQIYNLQW